MTAASPLASPVTVLPGIGARRAAAFEKLGIATVEDLLNDFPRAYEDHTVFRTLQEVCDGETACIRATASAEPRLTRIRRGLSMVKLRAFDDTAAVDITWFNQNWVADRLQQGTTYVFYGKVSVSGSRRTMANPSFEPAEADGASAGTIVPVYRLTQGLTNKLRQQTVRAALKLVSGSVPDVLPAEYGFPPAEACLREIHIPTSPQALTPARRRFLFEEVFIPSCAMGILRAGRESAPGPVLPDTGFEPFLKALPFSLTGAQTRALRDCGADMSSGRTMCRLVQGDVGSGKTAVAAACLWKAYVGGYQSAFMAPTELLAEQQFRSLEGLLGPLGARVGLLTGSMTAKQKREVLALLESGTLDVLVGTHALFSSGVRFRNLALVVTDEQHRFGVAQRAALAGKGESPHTLVMSATPIPRTLALMIYGDLDVSVLDELPPGRRPVQTFLVNEAYRARLTGFIRKQAEEGHRVFVVCPKVEEDEDEPSPDALPLKNAETHARELAEALPGIGVGCVHGRMRPAEKEEAMAAFIRGDTPVLVSTTVVEVGVDVPEATLMVIENAERFGLSQLHQLRGRVGRGKDQSWCILVSDSSAETAQERLKVLTQTNDGFKVAEEDLKARGPGDFFGSRQHGLPALHTADLLSDMTVLEDASRAAADILSRDPALASHPALAERVNALLSRSADTWN